MAHFTNNFILSAMYKDGTYLQLVEPLDAGREAEAIQLHWKRRLPVLFGTKRLILKCTFIDPYKITF